MSRPAIACLQYPESLRLPASKTIDCYADPKKDPDVDEGSLIRFKPLSGREQPKPVEQVPVVINDATGQQTIAYTATQIPEKNAILPANPLTHVGEYRHYSDPETGKCATPAPLLRRELRRHRNDLIHGELTRVIRDFETFRTDEFHWRGCPPAYVGFHYGKNPRHVKYDGCWAIDHDRQDVMKTLVADAGHAFASYTHKVATEVCSQEFENMLVHTSNLIHDKRATQHSKLRSEEDRQRARQEMDKAKALQKAYHEKLMFDAFESRKLIYCRGPQMLKTYGGMDVTPLHYSTEHLDGTNSTSS